MHKKYKIIISGFLALFILLVGNFSINNIVDIGNENVWTSTRNLTSSENAQKHFEKHGTEFSAKSKSEYVNDAINFINNPPNGTLTITQKDMDTVFFHPPSGVFAIKTKNGQIRTYFKREENLKGYKSNMQYFNEQAHRK